jgi:D-lyxose ketol-isomerase
MKRSQINKIIKDAEVFIEQCKYPLPPFARWTPKQWETKGSECDEMRQTMLGWDITDYGLGEFNTTGLVLFTSRNGSQYVTQYSKPYAEKILISQENQICPLHFHRNKMEDIINRGGGVLVMKLYNSDRNEGLADTNVIIVSDGVLLTVPAGAELELNPGESITLPQYMYHAFWAKKDMGAVLIGEISKCNDDNTDNRFYEKVKRFPVIDEDEAPYRLLCNEYS